ncbi:endoribonuclease ysh1 [Gurleya vavrai]
MQTEKIVFMPLGAGNEVGRSCMYLKYLNTSILFEIGIHPAYVGTAGLPFLDLIDLSIIDAIFVTHFHLDHAGALPYLTERTNFKGKVYMTHPTKAILKYLLNDYTRLVNSSSELDFYSEGDLKNCYDKITAIDYHQEVNIKEFKISALNAGHVLGAAMFLMKIKKTILLYTGDYSREEDRHLKPAESPGKLDVLISESTYGVQCHLPREEREKRFTSAIKEIVMRGGKVLLPVFALGRAQEILLILEEYWQRNKEIQHIPIFYASALAKKCIGIYQTYSSSNKRVSFNFKFINNIVNYEDSKKPCVVMASPGMLQSGLSRDLFEKWCEDKKNGVIVPGYCVNGTLAKEIMNEPDEIESIRGGKLKLKCSIDFISFSAHVDYLQNSQFIEECNPKFLFLVHGEMNEMHRLKNALKRENIFCLKNGESHEIEICREKSVKMKNVVVDKEFEGILKGDGEDFELFMREDLKEINLIQKVKITDGDNIKLAYIEKTYEKNNLFNNELNFEKNNKLNNKLDDEFFNELNNELNNEITNKLTYDLKNELNNDQIKELNDEYNEEKNNVKNIDLKNDIDIKLDSKNNNHTKNFDNDENERESIRKYPFFDNKRNEQLESTNINNLHGLDDIKNENEMDEIKLENKTCIFNEKNLNQDILFENKKEDSNLNQITNNKITKIVDKPSIKSIIILNNDNKAKKICLDDNNVNLAIQKIPFNSKVSLVKNTMLNLFDEIKENEGYLEIDDVKIKINELDVIVEWKSNYANDILANAIIRNIQNIGKTMESIKISRLNREETLLKILKNHYADVNIENKIIVIKDGKNEVLIKNEKVIGEGKLKEKIEEIFETVTLIFE